MKRRSLADQLWLFGILWAVGHLAHVLRKASAANPASWLLIVACVLLIGRPDSRRRLALVAAAQLALLFSDMPITDNHLYMMGFVNAGLLTAAAASVLRDRGEAREHLATAPAYARVAILLAYSAAAVAKLNHGFFDRSASCAVSMFYDAARAVGLPRGFLPAGAETLMPFAIAGTELAIPVLLLVPRSRAVGVGVVVLFHLAMSLSPTATAVDFTLVLFAAMVLFLPTSAARTVRERLRGVGARIPWKSARNTVARAAATIIATAALGALVSTRLRYVSVPGNRNWLLLAPTAVLVGAALLHLAWRSRAEVAHQPLSWRVGPVQCALVALLLLNVAAPYLGLKTVGTFTMYSNLQTSGGASNHLFFPRSPFPTPADDLVLVVGSSDARLRRLGEQGIYITWHELRRRLAARPDASISYVRNGGPVVTLERARDDEALVTRHRLLHWLVAYRNHDSAGARCSW